MSDKGRLVITGANGFIGLRLVELALAQGWSVTALARNRDSLAGLAHPRLTTAQWCIENPYSGREFFAGADAVCHLAAFIPPDHSDPGYAGKCFQINALGTLAAVRLAIDVNVGRFVLFSSGQAYAFREKPATEEDPLYPSHRATFYLSSKVTAELYLQYFSSQLRTTIFRLASVYGSNMQGGVVAQFIRRIGHGEPLIVNDEGLYRVDMVHVDDVATAALLAIENEADGVFNIGSGHGVSTLDIARTMVRLLDLDPRSIKVLPAPDGGVRGFSTLDIGKARSLLGFEPVQLEEGLRRCWPFSVTFGSRKRVPNDGGKH